MFDNTFTITVGGVDHTVTRVNQDKFASTYRYRSGTLNLDLLIRHTDRPTPGQIGIRTERHNVELTATTFTVVDGVTIAKSVKAYFVFEIDTGADAAIAVDLLTELASTFITASGVALRLANWES